MAKTEVKEMIEVFKDIEGYEGIYQISNQGRVKSQMFGKEKILKPQDFKGYKVICLHKYKKVKRFLVHRLVGGAFIPNIENKPTINHINGIKNDNRLDNLEWATYSENRQHAYDNGLQRPYKRNEYHKKKLREKASKIVIDQSTGIFYDSCKEASESLGFNRNTFTKWLNGRLRNKSNCIYV